jgi:hypothetical protein
VPSLCVPNHPLTTAENSGRHPTFPTPRGVLEESSGRHPTFSDATGSSGRHPTFSDATGSSGRHPEFWKTPNLFRRRHREFWKTPNLFRRHRVSRFEDTQPFPTSHRVINPTRNRVINPVHTGAGWRHPTFSTRHCRIKDPEDHRYPDQAPTFLTHDHALPGA